MDSLIDTPQSVFITGRCILDNVVVAEETIFSLQKRKMPGNIIKVDFAKAFNMVDSDFFLELLHVRGFGDQWIGWIKCILYTSKTSILVNGAVNGYVKHQRGLRQGDPLSHLLFVLDTDVLSTLFSNALSSGVLNGVLLRKFGKICHLQYTDDLIILIAWGLEDLRIIKLILYFFDGISGLSINFHKTRLYSSKLGTLLDRSLAATLNCSTGLLPLTYLGFPISTGDPTVTIGIPLYVKSTLDFLHGKPICSPYKED